MSKTVRVKVEFEVNVVVGDGLITDSAMDYNIGELTGVGKYVRSFPEASRHLVMSEQISIAFTKDAINGVISQLKGDGIHLKGLGNVRAQVISEKK